MKFPILITLFFLFACTSNSNLKLQPITDVTKDTVAKATLPKIISDPTNVLEKKVQQLELEYIVWGCACANWITPEGRTKYEKESTLSDHCIFLEPADSNLTVPDFFNPATHSLIVEGQFYVKEDYPQGTIQTEQTLEKAKVFRYTKFRMIAKGSKLKSTAPGQTLSVVYGAIGCTCAQWSKINSNGRPGEQEYFYLERANDKLPDADTLFNGKNLPRLLITGYFITYSGYPQNYNPAKGGPDPAKVFRYEKLKILPH